MASDEAKILEKITTQEKKIEKEEEKIESQSKELAYITKVLKNVATAEKQTIQNEERVVASELNIFQRFFLARAKKHKIIFQLVIIIGIILVWRGLWELFDQIPVISSALISLVVGLFVLWLFNRITDLS